MRLEKKEAALIFKPNGTLELVLPKFKNTENVPIEVLYATAITLLIEEKDKAFAKIVENKVKKMIRMIESKNEK